MNPEPRFEADYTERQVTAAHRVLIDVGQVLASFSDCMVVVGGWVPDLRMPDAEPSHVGSIDVDIALDAARLNTGRYAALLKVLLETRRYRQGSKSFQFVTDVDLGDGEKTVQVEVDFLAPTEVKLIKNRPKLLAGFRVLQTEACGAVFRSPQSLVLTGKTIRGADNTVRLHVASVAEFLVMKAHAIGGRDKPKDSYDLCYCLENYADGIEALAADWRAQRKNKVYVKAATILKEKFAGPEAFGPQQVVEFHNASDAETQAMQARQAYEAVQRFLYLVKRWRIQGRRTESEK